MIIKIWKKLRKFDRNFSGFVFALGQKQTYAVQNVMSALPPIADMCSALAYVCFGPIADMALLLFDHFIRDGDYPWRHLNAEQPHRLKV
jgi:hypothetical protein